MQIGRRIYYELLTGNIIADTGERSGSVVSTTTAQDFEFYTALTNRNPLTVGMLQLEFGERAQDFAQCVDYRVNVATGKLEFNFTTPIAPYKEQKIAELNRRCNESILAGFTSNALGTDSYYSFDYDSQINLGGMLNAITAELVPEPVVWKASNVPQNHSFAQFKTVFLHGLAHKNNMISKYWLLKNQVDLAGSNEEVALISWD
jgi:hypothetical protein